MAYRATQGRRGGVPRERGRGCGGKRPRLPCLERKRSVALPCVCLACLPRISKQSRQNNREAPLPLIDKYGRDIHDLRISITDRCNYKCVYCRTGNDGPAFPEMPIADYLRMVRVFVWLGITKIRLTGGEPSSAPRPGRDGSRTWALRTVEGEPLEMAITTNGHLLAEMGAAAGRCRTRRA